jgi:hypothetical protein
MISIYIMIFKNFSWRWGTVLALWVYIFFHQIWATTSTPKKLPELKFSIFSLWNRSISTWKAFNQSILITVAT